MPPLVMTGYSQLAGGVLLTLAGLIGGGRFGAISPWGVGIFAYILLASSVGYGLWYSLLKNNDLSRLFIIKFLEPVFAAVLGVLLLQEEFSVTYLFAFVLTVLAILVSHVKDTRER